MPTNRRLRRSSLFFTIPTPLLRWPPCPRPGGARRRADVGCRANSGWPTAITKISAGLLLIVGLARVFHFEKGASYYFHTWTFIAKLALFVTIGLVSIIPTIEFLSWRQSIALGTPPAVSATKVRMLRSIIHLELAGVVFILLFAAMMAKGIGLMP